MTIAIIASVVGVVVLLALAAWGYIRQTKKFERLRLHTEQLEKMREVERVARENWQDIDSHVPDRKRAARDRVLQEVGRIVSDAADVSKTSSDS